MVKKSNIDWSKIGFSYIKTNFRYVSSWKNGKWDKGKLTEDNMLVTSEGSTSLHYGQQCFEGLKTALKRRKYSFSGLTKMLSVWPRAAGEF